MMLTGDGPRDKPPIVKK